MNSSEWGVVFRCGCTGCHIRQLRYFNYYIPEDIKEVDYKCLLKEYLERPGR